MADKQYLPVLETGSLSQHGQVRALLLAADFLHLYKVEGVRELSFFTSPKSLPSKTVTMGVRFQYMNFKEHKQTIAGPSGKIQHPVVVSAPEYNWNCVCACASPSHKCEKGLYQSGRSDGEVLVRQTTLSLATREWVRVCFR